MLVEYEALQKPIVHCLIYSQGKVISECELNLEK